MLRDDRQRQHLEPRHILRRIQHTIDTHRMLLLRKLLLMDLRTPLRKKREYTTEMAAVVKRVRKCKVTEYYEILGLTKSCEENDVKRAYKKVCFDQAYIFFESLTEGMQLALQLHPDKNGAPGADEAFKSRTLFNLPRCDADISSVVSKAFQVLSDPQ